MPITFEEGTQTATVTTEHTLNATTPETTDALVQVVIDVANMAAGDTTEIRIKEKVKAAGTQRTEVVATLVGAQTSPYRSPALVLGNGWDVTLKQTAGTGRSYDWSIRKVS